MAASLLRKGGFTLVELLVVVLIIGILAGVAVPKVVQHVDNAKKTACRANMRQIETALEAYYLENGYYPEPSESSLPTGLELKRLPECPAFGAYTYERSAATDYTLKCEKHGYEITAQSENLEEN
ncbi:MAG TPA: prepilin-type N-terminal cleavage/methylation domain-containing protein [Firmicutes bacterium]|nr:prepilin-type N-terminal cleavage/methylation domain-containing protein [Bacillota bacterium]